MLEVMTAGMFTARLTSTAAFHAASCRCTMDAKFEGGLAGAAGTSTTTTATVVDISGRS